MKRELFILSFFVFFQASYGQEVTDTTLTFRIETVDGNVFIGKVTYEDQERLVLETERLGNLNIKKADIRTRVVLNDLKKVGKDFWLPNPQSSRYFWAPNGYGLEKGSAYYQNIWIFYNQVSFGITDNFSLGGGMIPLFLFGGAPTPIWIVPKFSIPIIENKLNIGTGAFLGTVLGDDSGVFGLLYGTTTLGSRDQNMSLGLAYGFAGGELMKVPIINLSTMIRTGPKGYFITENYVIPSEGEVLVLLSLGGRSIIRNVGLDYSLWIPLGIESGLVGIPFLGITVPLVKRPVR